MIKWLKEGFQKVLNLVLTTPEANSRLVYLMHGTSIACGTLMACIAFVVPHFPDKHLVPDVIMALGASTGAAGVGRWATKKGDDGPGK